MLKITPSTRSYITLERGFTDFLKLVAAIMVAMGHYSGHALEYVSSPILKFFVMNGGSTGVAIFFFLSGYGLMMSERKKHLAFGEFIKRRLMKVYVPVVIVSAIWGIIRWPENAGTEHLPAYFKMVFVTFGDGILWFIRVIAVMYLLFYGYTLIRRNKLWRLPVLALGTVVAYILVYFWIAGWAAISVPIFTLGVILVEYNEHVCKVICSSRKYLWLVLISALMVMLYLLYGNLYMHALINYFAVTGIVMLCAYKNIDISVPNWLGGISYDIYLTHNKVINMLRICSGGYIPLHIFLAWTVITSAASYAIRTGLTGKVKVS